MVDRNKNFDKKIIDKYIKEYRQYGLPKEALKARSEDVLQKCSSKFREDLGYSYQYFISWHIKYALSEFSKQYFPNEDQEQLSQDKDKKKSRCLQ